MNSLRPRFPDNDIKLRIKSPHRPGKLGLLLTVLGEEGALVGDIETLFIGKDHSFRNITISIFDEVHLDAIKTAINNRTEVEILEIEDIVFKRHEGGKIHSKRKQELRRLEDLRYIYTPGVARVCRRIMNHPESYRKYTNIGNSVGIFTNGTRVLGLGEIGVLPSMPVMEGKAVIYDQFVGISATPILVDTKDPDEFIETVERIAPTFGGIHLEDIRIPDCFYIETELIKRLNKPVMHDDQHGTATVLLAAVLSALRQIGRTDDDSLVFAQLGLGAAGFGIAKLMIDYGFNVIGVDPMPESQKRLTNYGGKIASLEEAMDVADIVIATTGVVGLIGPDIVRKGQVILSLSNPQPEIFPEEALAAGASFASDGKSVNNALAYPGLFKAALEVNANEINAKMKIAAAKVISEMAETGELVPSIFHEKVHQHVVKAVVAACK
ncbi:MAG: NAD-dependent malic enzyme [Calditrichaeota bacterium]|nr:NAD-dependent malic enzyme [Calditrichota bacterium]MCB0270562.1 NAD-dependent malic enzyme [Calditrichota bacterium]